MGIVIGCKVKTISDFEELRKVWNLPYPRKGDILTVKHIEPHPNRNLREKGIVLLYFIESNNPNGVCNKKVNGDINFQLIQPIESEIVLFEEINTEHSISTI